MSKRRKHSLADHEREKKRAEREAGIVNRMIRRADSAGLAIHPLMKSYAYWQCCSCGWDVVKDEFRIRMRKDPPGPMYEPDESPTWLWWITLNPKSRWKFVKMSRGMRTPVSKAVGTSENNPIEGLNNPAFEIVRAKAEND